jgi:uncharacterized repeat protein (TIGR01451 family)
MFNPRISSCLRIRRSVFAASLALVLAWIGTCAQAQVVGDLPAGKTIIISHSVIVDNGISTSPVVSQGTVTGLNFNAVLTDDPDLGGATDPTLTNILLTPLLGVTKLTSTPGPLDIGDFADFTIEVSNGSAGALNGVELNDIFDQTALAFDSASIVPDGNDPGFITWNVGNLAPGESTIITCRFVVVGNPNQPFPSTVTNEAAAVTETIISDVSEATVQINAIPPQDLDIQTILSPTDLISVGNIVSLELINRGAGSLNGSPIDLQYSIDNGGTFPVTQTFIPTTLGSTLDTEVFTFTVPFTLSGQTSIDLCVRIDPQVQDDPDAMDQLCSLLTLPPPEIICPADAVLTCGDDTSTNVLGIAMATASDACPGLVTINFSDSSVAGCGATETITRTWTATDTCGGMASCTQMIVVVDSALPDITCPPNVILECGDSTSPTNTGFATATDACDTNVTITSSDEPLQGNCPGEGGILRTWMAVDACGNTNTCIQEIILVDTTPPVLTCPDDVFRTNDFGECSASMELPGPDRFDACSMVTVSNNFTLGSDPSGTYPVGVTEVIWTATDGCGNASTCTQLVTIVDAEFPVFVCPSDVLATNDPGVCSVNVSIPVPSASDNCPGVVLTNNVTGTSDASGVYQAGLTMVVWTATDAAGNATICTQLVNIVDSESPVLTCPSDIVATNDPGVCEANLTIPPPFLSDNCMGSASVTNDFNGTADASGVFPVGMTRITWTAMDLAGNTATCTQTVTVVDGEAPLLVCPEDKLKTNDVGQCSAGLELSAPTVTDNCPGVIFTNNFTGGSDASGIYSVGLTEVVWTATDASGNTAICTQLITVVDAEAPVLSCPPDVAVNNDPDACDAFVSISSTLLSDNCMGIASVTNNFTGTADATATYPIGLTRVIWTATDLAGNQSVCTQLVEVADVQPPAVACPPDVTIECDASTNVVDTGMATATDNCTNVVVTFSDAVTDGNCPAERMIVRTWTVVDGATNMAACVQVITVEDTTAPTITCPGDISVLNDIGVDGAVVTFAVPSSDNCDANPQVVCTPVSGSLFPLGTTTVTCVASDICDNSTNCSFNVVVTQPVDLAITKSADRDPAFTNQELDYTLTVANNGIRDGRDLVITDALPPFVMVQQSSLPAGCTAAAGVVTCLVADLPVGASTSLTFTVDVQVPIGVVSVVLTNVAEVTSFGTEQTPLDNVTTHELLALGLARLTLIDDLNGFGTIVGATSGLHLANSMFDLEPVPINSKYVFDQWFVDGAPAGSDNPLHLTLLFDTTVRASFVSSFVEVTAETTATLDNWHLDFSTGIMYSDLTLCNIASNDVRLIEPFWYAAPSTPTRFLIDPDGTTNGVPYIDITDKVNAALPLVGNLDAVLDTNECVTISEVAWYRVDAVRFDGTLIAVQVFADPPAIAPNSYYSDTDRDGIINGWEVLHGLNPNHPMDAAADPDLDGASNLYEYQTDTIPVQSESILKITRIDFQASNGQVEWVGGEAITQFIEWAPSVNGPWSRLYTNDPPTTVTGTLPFNPAVTPGGVFRVTVGESK